MRTPIVVAAFVSLATTAHAADNGFFLGAGLMHANVTDIGGVSDFKLENSSYKLIAGFRPLDHLGFELNYMDLGNENTTAGGVPSNVNAKAFAGFAVGYLPISLVDLYAKAGLARWDSKGSSTLFSFDKTGTDFAYGVGLQIRFGSLAARLEYERFDIENTNGAELATLGATWTFL